MFGILKLLFFNNCGRRQITDWSHKKLPISSAEYINHYFRCRCLDSFATYWRWFRYFKSIFIQFGDEPERRSTTFSITNTKLRVYNYPLEVYLQVETENQSYLFSRLQMSSAEVLPVDNSVRRFQRGQTSDSHVFRKRNGAKHFFTNDICKLQTLS